MTTFTIENETNNITLHFSAAEAETVSGAERFSSSLELAELAATWPTARLIEIWNSLPGVTPVTKFKDRKTAVTRIWKAIQSLGADVPSEPAAEPGREPVATSDPVAEPEEIATEAATLEPDANVGEQVPDVAPVAAEPTKKATRRPKAPTGENVVKAPREASKTSRVIGMLKREGGATLEQIMTEMGWLKHTTRAMLSAAAPSRRTTGWSLSARWSAKSGPTRSRANANVVPNLTLPDSTPAAFLVLGISHGRSEATTAVTWIVPMTATGMDFPEHVENKFSWPALPSVIVRILGDALPRQNKRPVIAVAIKHDPRSFGQPCDAVLRNLLGDDEVWGTCLDHP